MGYGAGGHSSESCDSRVSRNVRADFGKGMRTATFQFSEAGGSMNGRSSSLNRFSCGNPLNFGGGVCPKPLVLQCFLGAASEI